MEDRLCKAELDMQKKKRVKYLKKKKKKKKKTDAIPFPGLLVCYKDLHPVCLSEGHVVGLCLPAIADRD